MRCDNIPPKMSFGGIFIMKKISKNLSVTLTQILLAALVISLAAACFFLPSIYRMFYGNEQELFTVTICCIYFSAGPAFAAAGAIYKLLANIKKGNVFTVKNVSYIRFVSWCCFIETLIYLILGFTRFGAFIIAFGAAFIWMILRVVKNVLDEATEIKSENEYTI